MMVLVTYDVATSELGGSRRLRQVAKTCVNYGVRVQKSVFECSLDPAQWEFLKAGLLQIIDREQDSLRFYFLGSNWKRRVEHHGVNNAFTFDEPIIV